jgi:hypothetical protein
VDGGTLVHINGSNIHPMDVKGLQCTFGLADKVNASFQSNEQVSCISPSYFEAGAISIVVTNNDGIYSSTVVFHYHSNPVLTSISPLVGTLTGGTVVVFEGVGFADMLTVLCRFGDISVLARYVSGRRMECVSPAQAAEGYQSLKVTLE